MENITIFDKRCPHCHISMYTIDGYTYTCPNCYNILVLPVSKDITHITVAANTVTPINLIPEPKIDKNGRFYRNCKAQRKRGAKICSECPFKEIIEKQEMKWLLE